MPTVATYRPDYAEGGPVRRRRRRVRLSLLAIALFMATGVVLVRRGVVVRVRLLYWQHRCATWDGPVAAPVAYGAPAAVPRCLVGLRSAMADAGWVPTGFFFDLTANADPVVFCHERVSPGGTRRIVAMTFRPNGDHMQLCSVDCLVVTPAGLTDSPAATCRCAAWVSGFQTNVRWAQLRPATIDPADASHFVFRYDETRCRAESDDDPWGADVQGKRPDQLMVATHTLDGWLRDDGSVDVAERSDDPPPSPPPVTATSPPSYGPLGPPRPSRPSRTPAAR